MRMKKARQEKNAGPQLLGEMSVRAEAEKLVFLQESGVTPSHHRDPVRYTGHSLPDVRRRKGMVELQVPVLLS